MIFHNPQGMLIHSYSNLELKKKITLYAVDTGLDWWGLGGGKNWTWAQNFYFYIMLLKIPHWQEFIPCPQYLLSPCFSSLEIKHHVYKLYLLVRMGLIKFLEVASRKKIWIFLIKTKQNIQFVEDHCFDLLRI